MLPALRAVRYAAVFNRKSGRFRGWALLAAGNMRRLGLAYGETHWRIRYVAKAALDAHLMRQDEALGIRMSAAHPRSLPVFLLIQAAHRFG